jgi:hypothetical protein
MPTCPDPALPYKLFCRIEPERIWVLRSLHAARGWTWFSGQS